jgi:hypothetical protein
VTLLWSSGAAPGGDVGQATNVMILGAVLTVFAALILSALGQVLTLL